MSDNFLEFDGKPLHRVLLRQGNNFANMVDLQLKAERNNGMSVYIKPPFETSYSSIRPKAKLALPSSGEHKVTLKNDVTNGHKYYNPYLSWHGSGKLHANAYSTKDLSKEIFLRDSPAVSLSDIAVPFHILFTLVLPISMNCYGKASLPPNNINYYEASLKPYRDNTLDKPGPLHLVIDEDALDGYDVIMDVMVANRGVNFDFTRNHPYPGRQVIFVAPPIKIALTNPVLPAVTIFVYQLIDKGTSTTNAPPMIFWGRSKGAQTDQMFQLRRDSTPNSEN